MEEKDLQILNLGFRVWLNENLLVILNVIKLLLLLFNFKILFNYCNIVIIH